MLKIIPLTKERVKKLNIFGADVSIGFAKYAEVTHTIETKVDVQNWNIIARRLNFLFESTEYNEIITTRLILWRIKIEVKTVVQYDFKFA